MAALQWLDAEDLVNLDLSGLSQVHEEALLVLRTGAMNRKPVKEIKRWVDMWAKEALKSSTRPQSRYISLHILVTSLGACPVESLLPSLDRVGQVLQSCLAATAPESCRRVACLGVGQLIMSTMGLEGAGAEELRQKDLELMPRVMPLLLACAREGPSSTTKLAALEALASSLRCLRSSMKQHASKIESAALSCLDSPSEDVQSRAATCLALLPSVLGEASRWTSSLNRFLQGITATLKQVWPDSAQLQRFSSVDGYQELFSSTLIAPVSSRDNVSAVQRVRYRLEGLLRVLNLMLEEGFAGAAANVPLPSLLNTLEGLMRLSPKPSTAMDASDPPILLPSEALHTLVTACRRGALSILLSLIKAARGQLLRYSSRLSKMVLRAVSWPVDHGLRPAAYSLLVQLVLRLGPALSKGLVEPCMPLLISQVVMTLETPKDSDTKAPRSGRTQTSKKSQTTTVAASSTKGGEEAMTVGALQALSSLVLSCGAVLSGDVRGELESVAARGLVELSKGWATCDALGRARGPLVGGAKYCPLRLDAPLRAAFLELVTSLMSCPCPDGAYSSTVSLACRVMDMACLDTDMKVAQAALHGRALAQALLHPRACPMYLPPSLLHTSTESTTSTNHGHTILQEMERLPSSLPSLTVSALKPMPSGSAPPPPSSSSTPFVSMTPVPLPTSNKSGPKEQQKAPTGTVKGQGAAETKPSQSKRPREAEEPAVLASKSNKKASTEAQAKPTTTSVTGKMKAQPDDRDEEDEDDFLPEIVDAGPDEMDNE